MLSITDCAKQIYSNTLKSFYFFTGNEYGVKFQYLEILKSKCDQVEEHESLTDLISALSKKTLIPRPKTLYICRYDSSFVQSLGTDVANRLKNLNFLGVIVGVYEDSKSEDKLNKFFPDNTVRINPLTDQIKYKHLTKDFPLLLDNQVKAIISVSADFYQALMIAKSLSLLPQNILSSLSVRDIQDMFRYRVSSSSESFKRAIAARNFNVAVNEIDKYEGDLSQLFYDILNTCLELAKMLKRSYGESFVTPYLKLWDWNSVVSYFDIAYAQLNQLRTISSYSPYIAITYTCSLLNFKVK